MRLLLGVFKVVAREGPRDVPAPAEGERRSSVGSLAPLRYRGEPAAGAGPARGSHVDARHPGSLRDGFPPRHPAIRPSDRARFLCNGSAIRLGPKRFEAVSNGPMPWRRFCDYAKLRCNSAPSKGF
jgi:hypothetical protein